MEHDVIFHPFGNIPMSSCLIGAMALLLRANGLFAR